MTRSPTVDAMQAETSPGRCIACDSPLPRSKGDKPRTVLCGDPDCQRLYVQIYCADRRAGLLRPRPRAA